MVQKIACVGSINLDFYRKDKIISSFLGGSASNTAFYLAEMCDPAQFSVFLTGIVGNDINAQEIRKQLQNTHINQEIIREYPGSSGSTQITLDQYHERTIKRSSSVTSQLPEYLADPKVKTTLKTCLIHVKGNYKVLVQLFRINRTILSADISGFIEDYSEAQFPAETTILMNQRQIQILFGNYEEFTKLAHLLGINERHNVFPLEKPLEYFEVIRDIQTKYNANVICVKMGSQGATIFSHNVGFHIPAIKVKVEDSTGAGDAFNAGFLYKFLHNSPLHICGLFACTLGSLKCTVFGPQSLKSPLFAIEKFHLT